MLLRSTGAVDRPIKAHRPGDTIGVKLQPS
jgi:hypothetical protein